MWWPRKTQTRSSRSRHPIDSHSRSCTRFFAGSFREEGGRFAAVRSEELREKR